MTTSNWRDAMDDITRRTVVDPTPRRSGRRTSICCECGQIRDVNANHYPRGNLAHENGQPDHWVNLAATGGHLGADAEASIARPYSRCLENLKCAFCGAVTEHAYLTGNDFAEHNNRIEPCSCPVCCRVRNEPSADKLAEIQYLESLYRQFGIEVLDRAQPITGEGGRPAVVAIVRNRTGIVDRWSVELSPDVTTQGRWNALRHALEIIAKSAQHRRVEPGQRGAFVQFGVKGDLAAGR